MTVSLKHAWLGLVILTLVALLIAVGLFAWQHPTGVGSEQHHQSQYVNEQYTDNQLANEWYTPTLNEY